MDRRPLGRSELVIEPWVLGTNVFGWTVDEAGAFAVLDAYVDHGFTAIDTAEGYPNWVPGNPPGMSETIIGKWLKARGNRDKVQVYTKVNSAKNADGLSAAAIPEAVEASLKRLQTDYIDLYFSHWPDETAHEETLGAYDTLIRAGKVRVIGASNYDSKMLREAQEVAVIKSLTRYEVVQPLYNLYDREPFESDLVPVLEELELGAIVYFSLGAGFLTGKYRSKDDLANSQRGGRVERYLDEKGFAILAALDAVAGETGASQAEVALGWLAQRPGVTAPIASATSVKQVESLARGVRLKLSDEQMRRLTDAGR